jgi:hypothetical protein
MHGVQSQLAALFFGIGARGLGSVEQLPAQCKNLVQPRFVTARGPDVTLANESAARQSV